MWTSFGGACGPGVVSALDWARIRCLRNRFIFFDSTHPWLATNGRWVYWRCVSILRDLHHSEGWRHDRIGGRPTLWSGMRRPNYRFFYEFIKWESPLRGRRFYWCPSRRWSRRFVAAAVLRSYCNAAAGDSRVSGCTGGRLQLIFRLISIKYNSLKDTKKADGCSSKMV